MPEIENQTTELTAEEVALLIADAPDPETGQAEFIPTDAAGADWVLGKMADHRARAQRIRSILSLVFRFQWASCTGAGFVG